MRYSKGVDIRLGALCNELVHTAAYVAIWIIAQKPRLCEGLPYKYVLGRYASKEVGTNCLEIIVQESLLW